MPPSLWDYYYCFIRHLKSNVKYVTKKQTSWYFKSGRKKHQPYYYQFIVTPRMPVCMVSYPCSPSCPIPTEKQWEMWRWRPDCRTGKNSQISLCSISSLESWCNSELVTDLSKITQRMRDIARVRPRSTWFPGLLCLYHRDSVQQLYRSWWPWTVNQGLHQTAEDGAPR